MAKDKALPLLNSERKELLQRITDANNRADMIHGACTRKFMGLVMRADFLTTEQKEKLAELVITS